MLSRCLDPHAHPWRYKDSLEVAVEKLVLYIALLKPLITVHLDLFFL